MTTPTIEIEINEELEHELELAIDRLTAESSPCTQLKILLCGVTHALCLRRYNDERQIRLRLPSP